MHPSDRLVIGNLAAAVVLAVVLVVAIGAMGRHWPAVSFDPLWVANAELALILAVCIFLAHSAWRISYTLRQLAAFLLGDMSLTSPAFAGTIQRLIEVLREEAAAMTEGLRDEPIP